MAKFITKNQLASAFTKCKNFILGEADKVIAILEKALAPAEAELEQIITDKADDSAMPTICGQPIKLYGAGTPQEAIVPTNWKQFDPETGEGYNWNGLPSAYGQEYIDTANGAKYEAVADGYYNLKWLRV